MGLRTASVRHPHAEVMAPALTETNQTQTFKLPPDEQSASPINTTPKQQHQRGEAVYAAREAATCKTVPPPPPGDAVCGTLNGDTPHDCAPPQPAGTTGTCPPSMADRDTMGLRKMNLDDVSDLLKADDDHIFDNLPAGDTEDLLQVFKSFGSEADGLADDLFGVDEVMNMSIDDEQAADAKERATEQKLKSLYDEVGTMNARLDRQLDFLLRRIRKHQLRSMGQHVSGEVVGVFENVCRTVKRYAEDVNDAGESVSHLDVPAPAELKPITSSATNGLIKKLELSNSLLTNAAFRSRMKKHPHGGPSTDAFRQPPSTQVITLPKWSLRDKKDVQNVSGFLESEMRLVQEEVDSEATVSSSGAESCDDVETYNNQHQQHLPIHKRAAWKYATDRAAIGARWTWLQSQIADLEYKIRTYSDLHRKQRAGKEPVKLGDASPPHQISAPSPPNCLNGYRGTLPGATTSSTCSADYQCARTRPLMSFRKRKLTQLTGLHLVSKKAERASTMRCGCAPPITSCALCTGRVDPTRPRDGAEYLSRNESLALLDASYHPAFCLSDAVSASLHVEEYLKSNDWKQWSVRSNAKALPKVKGERADANSGGIKEPLHPGRPRKNIEHRKKNNRLIKTSTVNALAAKIKNRSRSKKSSRRSSRSRKRARKPSGQSLASEGHDDEMDMLGVNVSKFESSNESPLLPHSISNFVKRNRADSYDIDNIIIPFSVAATVRVEKLQYKEILTPKWRHIAEDDNASTTKHDVKNNGVVKTSQDTTDKESFEDLSDAAVLNRHERSEQEEKKKFLSYLKLPIGYGRSRANRRTDSRAESSGANTPDPMSPAPSSTFDSALDRDASRPSTPKTEDHHLPAASARRRTISNTRGNSICEAMLSFNDALSVPPYDKRSFPLQDDTFQRMLQEMTLITNRDLSMSRPSSPISVAAHLPSTNSTIVEDRSEDASSMQHTRTPHSREISRREEDSRAAQEHDSESTESAFGDDDPDPTDPEWEAEHSEERSNR